jgi:hypothetical protein
MEGSFIDSDLNGSSHMADGKNTAIVVKYLPQVFAAIKNAFNAWRERRRAKKAGE